MLLSEYKKIDNIPGIYMIRNNINNKCYIGQSIRLRKRIQTHYHNANSVDNDNTRRMILYHAIKKYGIDNFTVDVLYSIDTTDYNEVKRKLDILEKEYIKQYNSYIPNGYNQTIGGDAGVLGLKMTAEQKTTISNNVTSFNKNGQFICYCYDITTRDLYTAVNITVLNDILHYNGVLNKNKTLYHSNCFKQTLVYKRFIIANTKEKLEAKKDRYINRCNSLSTYSCSKYTDKMKDDILNNITTKDFCAKYNVCKKTFYNYRKKILSKVN